MDATLWTLVLSSVTKAMDAVSDEAGRQVWQGLVTLLRRARRQPDAVIEPDHPETLASILVETAGRDPQFAAELRAWIEAVTQPSVHQLKRDKLPVPRQLPAGVRGFVGRESSLAALNALLPTDDRDGTTRPGAVVITAIDGAGGIGKTALAVHWAHQVRDHFPDGTLYANLRGYGPGQPVEPAEVLAVFLHALGVPADRIPSGAEEMAAVYRTYLDGRHVLVVLDNARNAEQVRALLPASSTCLALVTSRSALTGLVVMQGAARLSLDLLSTDEAEELLRSLVGETRAAAEPEALTEIVAACGRLPLALSIAGHRAAEPHCLLADLRDELVDARERLDVLSAADDEVASVRAVFDWSYQALTAELALVFRRLGLYPGTEISIYATAALVGIAPTRARRALDALARAHMVEPVGRGRYTMHDLLRSYAQEHVKEEADTESLAMVRRLLEFFLYTTDIVDQLLVMRRREDISVPPPQYPLTFSSDQEAFEWFKTERPNLLPLVTQAYEYKFYDLARALPNALAGLLDKAAHRQEWLRLARISVAAAERNESVDFWSLSLLNSALRQLGQFDEAVDTGRYAVDLARGNNDQPGVLLSLDELGRSYFGAKRYPEALECYAEALKISQDLDDEWSIAINQNNLGEVHLELRHSAKAAIELYRKALEVFRARQDDSRIGWTLRLLGDAYRAYGQTQEAEQYFRQAIIVLHKAYSLEEARAQAGLGDCLHRSGQMTDAFNHWRQALVLFEEIGDPQAEEVRKRLGLTNSQP